MSYFDRLRELAKDRRTLLCVGLDPDPERIEGGAAGALRHCREVVRQTEEHVCCYKPNSAFWEQYGPDGWAALLELRDEAPETPFLFPGIGAQGGDLEGSVRAAWNGDAASCLVSASRSVLFADRPSREAAKLQEEINAVVGALR